MICQLLSRFVCESRCILGNHLTGVYLHGSLAMGCFHPQTSDLDLLVIVRDPVPDEVKRRYMDMVVSLDREAPDKGIEMSIIRKSVLDPFRYPTPFELHFSKMHLAWYLEDPEGYIAKMRGTDPDLAAHFTILKQYGRVLWGEEISSFLKEVPKEAYLDSILRDIADAQTDIAENPVYVILNLSRVLAYVREGRILSKKDGGLWALEHTDEKYRPLIRSALEHYENGGQPDIRRFPAKDFASDFLRAVRAGIQRDKI